MMLRHLVLIGLMYPLISLADNLSQPARSLAMAKQFIDADQGKRAWAIIQPLLRQNTNFDVFILAAQANAELDNPELARDFYEKAYAVAKTPIQKNVADAGIAKMDAWALSQRAHKSRPKPSVYLIRTHINNGEGTQALTILKPQLDDKPTYALQMLAAQSYAVINQPQKALESYIRARLMAKSKGEVRAAELGIAKMQFWLGEFYRAEHTYEQILQHQPEKTDRELALAGKVKSLAYMDRPMRAYRSIPDNLIFTTPDMVVAAAQAALWSDWADISSNILKTYAPIRREIPANSPLDKDLKDLVWQVNQGVSPNTINPAGFFSGDSENFQVSRGWLDYSHYWSQKNQTFVGTKYTHYSQDTFALDAESVYFRQTWRPTRQLIVRGQVEPTNFQGWQPVFGVGGFYYQPNDYLRFTAGGLREVVETFPAFTQHITDSQVNAGVAIKPLPYIQLNGALSKLDFSDTNDRYGYYVSASALVLPRWGLSLLLQKRSYKDRFVSPYYFSPNYYDANTAVLRFASRTKGVWHYYVDGGIGNQVVQVNGTLSNYVPTHQWGVGITGPIRSWLILNAYYSTSNQATSFRNTPDYRYQSGGVSLNILL